MSRRFLNGIDATSQRIINVASPSSAADATNKSYVDNLITGLSWKLDVRAATTANGTLATAYANGQVVDGVTLATGDRILIKNQTTQTENGIYTVNASGAPTRATDADATSELNNATVSVLDGTANTATSWTQTTKNPTVGSSNIVWGVFAAGQIYTAGNGLQLVTNAFSVLLDGAANSGLAAAGTGLKVNPGPGIITTGGSTAINLAASNPALSTASGLTVIAGTGITLAGNSVAIDLTAVARKFATSVGNASLTSFTVTHNLNTLDVQVQVYDNSTTETVEADVTRTGVNTVVVAFAAAPATNAYRVLVTG